MPCSSIAEA
ncbi:hypothetical protein D030_3623A, partial [Vibrio parahaemolyticus AQ3810]